MAGGPSELTDRVAAWQAAGRPERVGDHQIHVHRRAGRPPPIVFLHGFPTSSYDFRNLLRLLGERAMLAFDFLGFGLSDKPRSHRYSLFAQADLAEELIGRHFPGQPAILVAHDIGTSVATELFARELEGRARIEITAALLFNGSIVLERASPTPAQRILRSPIGPLASRLSSFRVFRHQLGSVFSAGHPLSDEEAVDQWSLVCHGGGRTLGHRLIAYMDEREEHAERWHGAVRDWPRDLRLAWGMQDPVATPAVLDALRELRPSMPVRQFAELGHYPQLEDPAEVARAVEDLLP